jgi:hypothetical protein
MTRVHSRIILIVGVALPRATSLRPHFSAAALSELVCEHFHLELGQPVRRFGVALTDVVLCGDMDRRRLSIRGISPEFPIWTSGLRSYASPVPTARRRNIITVMGLNFGKIPTMRKRILCPDAAPSAGECGQDAIDALLREAMAEQSARRVASS